VISGSSSAAFDCAHIVERKRPQRHNVVSEPWIRRPKAIRTAQDYDVHARKYFLCAFLSARHRLRERVFPLIERRYEPVPDLDDRLRSIYALLSLSSFPVE
jgi:hypothetical protein